MFITLFHRYNLYTCRNNFNFSTHVLIYWPGCRNPWYQFTELVRLFGYISMSWSFVCLTKRHITLLVNRYSSAHLQCKANVVQHSVAVLWERFISQKRLIIEYVLRLSLMVHAPKDLFPLMKHFQYQALSTCKYYIWACRFLSRSVTTVIAWIFTIQFTLCVERLREEMEPYPQSPLT